MYKEMEAGRLTVATPTANTAFSKDSAHWFECSGSEGVVMWRSADFQTPVITLLRLCLLSIFLCFISSDKMWKSIEENVVKAEMRSVIVLQTVSLTLGMALSLSQINKNCAFLIFFVGVTHFNVSEVTCYRPGPCVFTVFSKTKIFILIIIDALRPKRAPTGQWDLLYCIYFKWITFRVIRFSRYSSMCDDVMCLFVHNQDP